MSTVFPVSLTCVIRSRCQTESDLTEFTELLSLKFAYNWDIFCILFWRPEIEPLSNRNLNINALLHEGNFWVYRFLFLN